MKKQRQRIKEPVRMKVPKRTYQPNRAELKAEIVMPELSPEDARKAFCRPFRFDSE